jgi:DNA repair exonuclease SbcCD nuclease subunit
MPNRSFRFLHASDFRLDAVPHGLTEVPDHLRDTLLDAPYNAARRVFDTALTERVAFVILAGNILQPDLTGPRGPAFLCEQFQRLADAGITVYWAGGEADPPDVWPTAFPLPENVRVFAKDCVTDFVHQYDGSPLARIVGTSRGVHAFHAEEFSPDAVGLFSIGVACLPTDTNSGQLHNVMQAQADSLENTPARNDKVETCSIGVDIADLQSRGMHYWALGGRAERTVLFNTPWIANLPGTPQGRSPIESGTHGCTLVNVDDLGNARMSFVASNAMEWLQESVLVDSSTRRENLEAMFAQRIHSLTHGSKTDLLITWTIGGHGPLVLELRHGKLRGELLEWLRIEHGLSSPSVWTVGIEVESQNAVPASLYEQETILGDFLRTLRELEIDVQRPLNLESMLAEEQAAGAFSQAVSMADPAARKRVLHQAALLAVDLLGGETTVQ